MKFYHRIGRRNNWLATRLLVGAGYAYGNSEVMPYSEQFYIGGANSIRAFTIRSLGPGSYRRPRTTATATSTRRATSNWKPTSNTASASWGGSTEPSSSTPETSGC